MNLAFEINALSCIIAVSNHIAISFQVATRTRNNVAVLA
jgi:hypothetical protein